MNDNIRTVWTDDELDRALAALHPAAEPRPRVLTAAWDRIARECLTDNETTTVLPSIQDTLRTGRPWLRWTAIAAAAVAIAAIGGGVAAHYASGPDTPAQASGGPEVVTAAMVLRDAGTAAIQEHDAPVPPGEFRYLRSEGWGMTTAVIDRQAVNYETESITQVWIPADYRQTWTMTRTDTGRIRWVGDGQALGAKLGIKPDAPRTITVHAPCGDFYPSRSGASCSDPAVTQGSWQHPSPAWLAGLPRDPRQLLTRLRQDAPSNARGDSELFNYASDALGSGLLPADLRGALYQALALLPDVTITQHAATLDGRTGVAFAISDTNDNHVRQEMVIDPATGDYIGGREIALDTQGGVPAGTVIGSGSSTTAIVGKAGATG